MLEEYQHDQTGSKQAFEDLSFITAHTRIEAMIADRPADVTDGDYVVDLYEAGFPEDEDENPGATRTGIPAFLLEKVSFDFKTGAIVEVVLTASGRAIIVPTAIPKGQGFGKILTLIDDEQPGRPVWDHPRWW